MEHGLANIYMDDRLRFLFHHAVLMLAMYRIQYQGPLTQSHLKHPDHLKEFLANGFPSPEELRQIFY